MSLFETGMLTLAGSILDICRERGLKIATAESCTGGLIAACFTEIAGSSDVFDRGFVTYSNAAKQDMLGVKAETLSRYGAVSRETAKEMAQGALDHSRASIAISVTGIAGPGGGSPEKPVGLVHIAIATSHGKASHVEHRFIDLDRSAVRLMTVRSGLQMLDHFLSKSA